MLSAGESDLEINEWLESQIPRYHELMEAIILDVAEEGPE
jgi:hypothetical protein